MRFWGLEVMTGENTPTFSDIGFLRTVCNRFCMGCYELNTRIDFAKEAITHTKKVLIMIRTRNL